MSCVGYRSTVFIKQMNPTAMTASVVAIMLRRVGEGDFSVRHDYCLKQTHEHWELGTWFRRKCIIAGRLIFSF